jgi:hypothetical protein
LSAIRAFVLFVLTSGTELQWTARSINLHISKENVTPCCHANA